MSKSKGVRCSFQAFCNVCNWTGAHWLGEGARKNALAEYKWHKEQPSHTETENRIALEILESNNRARRTA